MGHLYQSALNLVDDSYCLHVVLLTLPPKKYQIPPKIQILGEIEYSSGRKFVWWKSLVELSIYSFGVVLGGICLVSLFYY